MPSDKIISKQMLENQMSRMGIETMTQKSRDCCCSTELPRQQETSRNPTVVASVTQREFYT